MALRLFWAPQSRVIVVPLIFAALFGLLLTGMTIGGTAGWLGYRVYYSLACVALIYGTDLLAERIVGTNGGGIGNELLAPFVSGLLLVGSLPVMFSVSTTIAMLSVAGVVWFLSGPRGRMLSWRIGGIWIVCLAALAPLGSPWTWMCPNQSRYSVVLLSVSAVALLILERALAFSSFGLRGLRSYWRRVRGKNVSIVAATLLLARLIGSGVQPNVQFLYFAGLGVVLVVVGRMAGARGWRFAGAVVVIVGGIRYAVFDLACSPVNEGIYYLITYGVAMILVSIAFKATVRVVSQTGNRLPMKDDSDG